MTEHVSNQKPTRVVRDHAGVDLLLKMTSVRCLGPFLRSPCTLGEAAAELDMAASSLAYWVGKFVRAGLVEVVEERQRAGKPIPVYRATAGEFHVPFDSMPPGRRDEFLHGSRTHVLAEYAKAMDVALAREAVTGVAIRPDPERGVEINLADSDRIERSIATEWWGKVELTPEEAESLRAELESITERYAHTRRRKGASTYITLFGLVPEPRRRR